MAVGSGSRRTLTKVTAPLHPLDNPAWSALTGPQRDRGEVVGAVARYHPGVSAFGAFADVPGPGTGPPWPT